MKVLITGAGGFIGSHLAEYCTELDYEVRAFVHYNSENRWGWLENSALKKDMEIFPGDVRDYDSVSKAIKGSEAVFHLAALIGIPYSYRTPIAYVRTNFEGTYNILEASKENNVSHVLITSTSETYGTAQYVPIDEKHPSVGQSPYSASKIGADALALSYFFSFDLPVKIVRPFNTYGPRQSGRAIIPSIIVQLLDCPKEIKLGHLFPTRDLTFVKDTVKGFMEIFKTDSLVGEVVNIGMNTEISIEDLAKRIAHLMGKEVRIVGEETRKRPFSSEVKQLRCDNTKILNRTTWKPEYDLDRGLVETLNWIRANLHFFKKDIFSF